MPPLYRFNAASTPKKGTPGVKFEPWGIARLAAEGQTLLIVSQRTTIVPFTVIAPIVAPMTKIVNKNFHIKIIQKYSKKYVYFSLGKGFFTEVRPRR